MPLRLRARTPVPDLPSCRTWHGTVVPSPDRHDADAPTLVRARRVPAGWVTACDLCGFARWDPPQKAEEAEQARVVHLTHAHPAELAAGTATLYAAETSRRGA